ncbi:unnamed protein product, partial [Symbiodinium microadriaticum]
MRCLPAGKLDWVCPTHPCFPVPSAPTCPDLSCLDIELRPNEPGTQELLDGAFQQLPGQGCMNAAARIENARVRGVANNWPSNEQALPLLCADPGLFFATRVWHLQRLCRDASASVGKLGYATSESSHNSSPSKAGAFLNSGRTQSRTIASLPRSFFRGWRGSGGGAERNDGSRPPAELKHFNFPWRTFAHAQILMHGGNLGFAVEGEEDVPVWYNAVRSVIRDCAWHQATRSETPESRRKRWAAAKGVASALLDGRPLGSRAMAILFHCYDTDMDCVLRLGEAMLLLLELYAGLLHVGGTAE